MTAPDWEQTLEKCQLRTLNKGDIVYERVRNAMRNGHAKWNKAKVVDCNHAIVRIRFEADGREAVIRYSDLYREQPAPDAAQKRVSARAQPSSPQPPLTGPQLAQPQQQRTGTSDEEYRAWVAQGQEMLAAIDRQRAATETDMRDVASKIETLDTEARKRIESLEAELIEAKREHQNDRAFMALRHEQLTTKLASLNDRRQAMAALMGEQP